MASIKTLAELYAYFETGDKPTQAQFEDLIYTMFQGLASQPKKYVALLSQTGTSAPVATVLLNTLGATPTWSYVDVGQYRITATGKFTLEKTAATVSQVDSDAGKRMVYQNDVDTIDVYSYDSLGAANNDSLNDGEAYTVIEITVYP